MSVVGEYIPGRTAEEQEEATAVSMTRNVSECHSTDQPEINAALITHSEAFYQHVYFRHAGDTFFSCLLSEVVVDVKLVVFKM